MLHALITAPFVVLLVALAVIATWIVSHLENGNIAEYDDEDNA